jgi:hypothetical protein
MMSTYQCPTVKEISLALLKIQASMEETDSGYCCLAVFPSENNFPDWQIMRSEGFGVFSRNLDKALMAANFLSIKDTQAEITYTAHGMVDEIIGLADPT